MPDSADPSIVVDAWVVADGTQDEFRAAMEAMFERLGELDGFLDGAILEGVDPTRFVTYARMRSSQDREAAFLDHDIEAMMRRIGGIARPAPHAYSLLRRFSAPASQERSGG